MIGTRMRQIPAGTGVYLHIPFCSVKCHYCDFACQAGMADRMGAYVDALEREIRSYPALDVATVYLGGGTPSTLPPRLLTQALEAVFDHFRVSLDAEVTMEINPGTGSPELWQAARQAGVNRVSVGAQVFDESALAALGRDHTVADIETTVTQLRAAGFFDLSLDLIYGLPGQTLGSWKTTVERAFLLSPEHFSIYSLQVEPRTAFGVWHEQGKIALAGEDAEREMLDAVVAAMERSGYRRYELSSWCKPGLESAHNRIYWHGRPYIGLGTGAHSYFEERRYAHDRSIDGYIRQPLPAIPELPHAEHDRMEEVVFMALRLVEEGLDRSDFERRFGCDVAEAFGPAIAKMVDLGMLELTRDRLRLTAAALPVANAVFAEFV
ncbi:MAG: radical SAM family heme chaperone HemW [Cyanobacteria bacterium REEB65]|nr:radical SAM family heme chaperone HemW [Cyanobacteria bacterium REEB65]